MSERNWYCLACGERGEEATEDARPLPYWDTCLADQRWYREMYPEGMKHHWANGFPLSVNEGRFWRAAALLAAESRGGSGARESDREQARAALRATAQAGEGQAEKHVTERTLIAWLIERGQPEHQVPTVWWSGVTGWTTDAFTALRFATRAACETWIDQRSGLPIPSHGGPEGSRFGRAVEHGFIESEAVQQPDRGALQALWQIRDLADMDREEMTRVHGSPERVLHAVIPGIAGAALAGRRDTGTGQRSLDVEHTAANDPAGLYDDNWEPRRDPEPLDVERLARALEEHRHEDGDQPILRVRSAHLYPFLLPGCAAAVATAYAAPPEGSE